MKFLFVISMALIFTGLLTLQVKAEPKVIYQGGHVIDAHPWLAPKHPAWTNKPFDKKELPETDARTPSLTPGLVDTKPLPEGVHLDASFCIVSADNVSTVWLNKHHASLSKKKTTCFAINLSADQYKRLQKRFPDLALIRASAEALANTYQIKHYPVLIDSQGVRQ